MVMKVLNIYVNGILKIIVQMLKMEVNLMKQIAIILQKGNFIGIMQPKIVDHVKAKYPHLFQI
jgi:hypothetical protein